VSRLPDEHIFLAGIIQEDVEGTGNHAIEAGVEEVARGIVELFHKDAERVVRIEVFELRAPRGNEVVVRGGGDTGVLELIEESLRRVGRKADIRGNELLVEDGRAEEARQLLFFDGIARKDQGVSESGEDKTSDSALERLKEGNLAIGEIESDVRLADLNVVPGRDGIDRLAVELQGIESSENLARGGTCAGRSGGSCSRSWWKERNQQKKENERGTEPHNTSVVTFGM
jgi:hypothetical protein